MDKRGWTGAEKLVNTLVIDGDLKALANGSILSRGDDCLNEDIILVAIVEMIGDTNIDKIEETFPYATMGRFIIIFW